MSIAINNTSSGEVASPSGPPYQLTWSHTVGGGSNRALIVSVSHKGNATVGPMTATYNGVAMTSALDAVYDDGTEVRTSIFYMLEAQLPAAGSYNIVVTVSGAPLQVGGGAVDITGAAQTAPEATNSTTYGSGGAFSSMSTSITTITDNALIVDAGGCHGDATVGSGGGGWGSGQTAFVNANLASELMYSGSYEVFASAGGTSQTQSWVDYACNRGCHCVAVFAEAGSFPVGGTIVAYLADSTASSTGNTLVLAVPSGVQDGDLLLAYVINEDNDPAATWTPPSGWTLYVDVLETGGSPGDTPALSIYYRLADSEPANYTWTLSASGRGLMGTMIAYRNVDVASPFDAYRTTATGSTGQPDPASITTVNDLAWVVASGFSDDASGYTTLSSGFVSRVEFDGDHGSGDGASLGICDLLIAAAGATDPGVFTGSDSEEWGAVTLALRQAQPVVVETSQNSGSGTSLTVSHTFTAGDDKKLVVFAGGEDSGAFSVSSVTYDGESLTKVIEEIATRNVVSAWYLDDADFPSTPGAYNVVVTYSVSVGATTAHVVGLQGAKQGAVDASNSSTEESSPTSITTTCTTTADDSLLLGSVNSGDGSDLLSPTTGQEVLEETSVGGFDLYTGVERIPYAGATSMGWDAPSNQYRLAQVVLAVARSSAAPPAANNTFFGWEH